MYIDKKTDGIRITIKPVTTWFSYKTLIDIFDQIFRKSETENLNWTVNETKVDIAGGWGVIVNILLVAWSMKTKCNKWGDFILWATRLGSTTLLNSSSCLKYYCNGPRRLHNKLVFCFMYNSPLWLYLNISTRYTITNIIFLFCFFFFLFYLRLNITFRNKALRTIYFMVNLWNYYI